MKMAPAPAPELLVFVSVVPAPKLSFFKAWIRLQLRRLFVVTHYYFQLSLVCFKVNEILSYQVHKTKRIYQTFLSNLIW